MKKGQEYHNTEWPALEYLKSLGYNLLISAEYSPLRDGDHSAVLRPHLLEALQRINKINEEAATAIYNDLLRIPDNETWIKHLRGGYSRKIQGESTKKTINLIDFQNPSNNTFSLATQFRVQSQ